MLETLVNNVTNVDFAYFVCQKILCNFHVDIKCELHC